MSFSKKIPKEKERKNWKDFAGCIFLTFHLNNKTSVTKTFQCTSRLRKPPWRTNRATSPARPPRAPSWPPPAPHRWWSPGCSLTSSRSTTSSNNNRSLHSTHPHQHFWGRGRLSGTRGSLLNPPGSLARTTAKMRSWFAMLIQGKVRKFWGVWFFYFGVFIIIFCLWFHFFKYNGRQAPYIAFDND